MHSLETYRRVSLIKKLYIIFFFILKEVLHSVNNLTISNRYIEAEFVLRPNTREVGFYLDRRSQWFCLNICFPFNIYFKFKGTLEISKIPFLLSLNNEKIMEIVNRYDAMALNDNITE